MESLFEPKGLFFVSKHDDLWSKKRGVFLFFRSYGVDLSLFFLKMVFEEDNVLLLDEPTRNPSSFSLEMLDSLLNSFLAPCSSWAVMSLSSPGGRPRGWNWVLRVCRRRRFKEPPSFCWRILDFFPFLTFHYCFHQISEIRRGLVGRTPQKTMLSIYEGLRFFCNL